MRKYLLSALFLLCLASALKAQTTGTVGGFCDQGATSAAVQGLNSTNKLQGIIPSCTVTVYLTGTQTLAPNLYSSTTNTPLTNPFTASAKGQWLFWASTLNAVDVVLSGGIAPNIYATPLTDKVGVFPSLNGIDVFYPPTIQQAVTAASVSPYGSVTVPGNYAGTDSWTNPHNIRLQDLRPYNPTNSATYTGPPVPQTTIKAADYGAQCNGDGVHDDTASIQQALNAAVTLVGGAGGGTNTMGTATVELPQGRCQTSNTLTMAGTGSLVGSANGTWIYPLEPWHGTTGDLVDVTDVYVPNAVPATHQGINRSVKNINFEYNFNTTAHTAIRVFSQYGSATGLPYPSSDNNPQSYQLQGVTISGNVVYAMDTGIEIDDCGQCVLENNQVSFVRVGLFDNGNAYSLVSTSNFFLAGSCTYTPTCPASTGGAQTIGEEAISSPRYYCNSPGTGAACTGGTVTTVIASPQGLALFTTEVEQFQIGGLIINCLGFTANGSSWDNGGPATGAAYPTLYFGQLKFAQLFNSFVSVNGSGANAIEVSGVSSAQGAGLTNQDGLWIQGNYIYGYQASTGSGILFDAPPSGNDARRNVYVTDNQLTNFGFGVDLLGGLTYSSLRGNYGNSITSDLFNFNNTAGWVGTRLEDNKTTSSVPVYVIVAGTGLSIGYNYSAVQISGTFTATGTACSIGSSSAGAPCGPVTMTISPPLADTNYKVTGCAVIGASAAAVVSLVNPPSIGTTFPVYMSALTSAAVTGGTIVCSLTDNQ